LRIAFFFPGASPYVNSPLGMDPFYMNCFILNSMLLGKKSSTNFTDVGLIKG